MKAPRRLKQSKPRPEINSPVCTRRMPHPHQTPLQLSQLGARRGERVHGGPGAPQMCKLQFIVTEQSNQM